MAIIEQTLEYNKERGTWNLFVNNEWYYEGDYETCSEMMLNNAVDSNDEYYGDDGDDYENNWADYYEETGNAPCDWSGMCTGSDCFNYPKCKGWVK